ncbi:hypothetical protein M8J76_009154 [Diaphorina citri]|nr:hypothetical protein M8J76_009154 [Diaphorina citri]
MRTIYVTGVSELVLKVEQAGGAWCPKNPVEKDIREFIQIDLGSPHVVTGVQTQGRYDHGRGQEYTEEYILEYWRPGLRDWKQYYGGNGKAVSFIRALLFLKVG